MDAMWNPNREKFSTKSSFSEYSHIVVDVDTRVVNALQIILEVKPDVILIPVDNQGLSITHGSQVISMINGMEGKLSYSAKVVFVQMGSQWQLNPPFYSIPYSENFDQCLNKSDYIWNVNDELEYMSNVFGGLIDYVK